MGKPTWDSPEIFLVFHHVAMPIFSFSTASGGWKKVLNIIMPKSSWKLFDEFCTSIFNL
jgi:hypothetical protein